MEIIGQNYTYTYSGYFYQMHLVNIRDLLVNPNFYIYSIRKQSSVEINDNEEYNFIIEKDELKSILTNADLLYVWDFVSKRNSNNSFIECGVDKNGKPAFVRMITNLTDFFKCIRNPNRYSTMGVVPTSVMVQDLSTMMPRPMSEVINDYNVQPMFEYLKSLFGNSNSINNDQHH